MRALMPKGYGNSTMLARLRDRYFQRRATHRGLQLLSKAYQPLKSFYKVPVLGKTLKKMEGGKNEKLEGGNKKFYNQNPWWQNHFCHTLFDIP